MRRILTALALIVAAEIAHAQNDVTFDISLSNPQAPVATWSSTPAGASCTASGDWTGSRPASGTATLPRPDNDPTYTLSCSWVGNQMTTLTWVNPTTNTDGTPLTNPGPTILAWTQGANFSGFDCMAPASSGGYTFASVAHPQTTHVIPTLSAGLWRFGAYKRNALGLCSLISNIETKTVTTGAVVSATVSFGVPEAPDLEVE